MTWLAIQIPKLTKFCISWSTTFTDELAVDIHQSTGFSHIMGAYYDEIEIEDMAWDDVKSVYHYPCPCGDRFEISRKQLANCEDIATCPSCSLIIRVVYDPVGHADLLQ
jgi:diphthamide biosynthesis protein 3